MSNKKVTAVQWLEQQLIKKGVIRRGFMIPDNVFHKALEMERQQIRAAMEVQVEKYSTAYINENRYPVISYDIEDSFNDYYNETYEGGQP